MSDNVDAPYVPRPAEPVVKVLVVAFDLSCAQSLDLALRSRSRRQDDLPYQVTAVHDSTEALARLALGGWDVLVTDMRPGLDGLSLVDMARVLIPNLGVVMLTEPATVDTSVTALGDGTQDVLVKPTAPTEVAESVTRVVRGLRRAATVGQHRVLAIGAHPDDVELGVGGTLLAHQAAGIEIVVLTLSRGAVGGTTDQRARESQHAAEMLGARLFHLDLPDTMISAGPPTVPAIEAVVAEVRPTTVYVHSGNDQHQDHHATFRAATVACRQVPRLYCYQSPSSSLDFHPNRFVPIDDWFEAKIG
ncbi:MAG: PIG-L family deacetylase, partial [Frankiaceae bacterium]